MTNESEPTEPIDVEAEVFRAVKHCQSHQIHAGRAVSKSQIERRLLKVHVSVSFLDSHLANLLAAGRLHVANGLWFVALLAMLVGCGSKFETKGEGNGGTSNLGQVSLAGGPSAESLGGSAGRAGGATNGAIFGVGNVGGLPAGSSGASGSFAGIAGAYFAPVNPDVAGAAGSGEAGRASAGMPSTVAGAAGRATVAGSPGTGGKTSATCPPCGEGICGNCTTPTHPNCSDPVFVYCF